MFAHPTRPHLFSALEIMTAARLQLAAATANPEKGKAFVTLKLTGTHVRERRICLRSHARTCIRTLTCSRM